MLRWELYREARVSPSAFAHQFGGLVTFIMVSPRVALDRKVGFGGALITDVKLVEMSSAPPVFQVLFRLKLQQ